MKRQTIDWEYIFATPLSDQIQVSRVWKKSHKSIRKRQTTQWKMGKEHE